MRGGAPVMGDGRLWLLVTGTRHATLADHWRIIRDALNRRTDNWPGKLTIVHGAAQGVDSIATEWAERCGIAHKPYPAQWDAINPATGKRFGAKAGPIRNQQMVDFLFERRDLGDAVGCLAFPAANRETRGTVDTIRRAKAVGIWVTEVKLHIPKTTAQIKEELEA